MLESLQSLFDYINETIKCENDIIYLTNQLIQVNQRPSPLLPQAVVRCALN